MQPQSIHLARSEYRRNQIYLGLARLSGQEFTAVADVADAPAAAGPGCPPERQVHAPDRGGIACQRGNGARGRQGGGVRVMAGWILSRAG